MYGSMQSQNIRLERLIVEENMYLREKLISR